MFLSIDFQSDVAIYLQIARQVKFAIAAGTLKPGQLLPSARVLSGRVTVNPNTVARAFTQLQSEGVIESLRGRGMVVCEDAVSYCKRERDDVLADRIGLSLGEAWHAGLDEKRIQSIVHRHLKRLAKTQPSVHATPAEHDPVASDQPH